MLRTDIRFFTVFMGFFPNVIKKKLTLKMYKFCKVITLIWPSHGTRSINSDLLTKTLNLTESQSISI